MSVEELTGWLGAVARLDVIRLRDALLIARAAQSDQKGFRRVLRSLSGNG